jgi:phosphoribosylamine---glycine ligase
MKFLLLSGAGDGLGLALRLKDEGNEVAVWIKNNLARDDFDGLLKKLTNWNSFLDKETIVVFDSTSGGKTADRLRSKGNLVFGGSSFADLLEHDRGTAFGIMEEVGIKVPYSETFTSFEEAKAYVKKNEQRLAFKPTGDMGPDVNTYVSYDQEDMLEMLDIFSEKAKGSIEFELQNVVEGLLISTEGWFNGTRFVSPFNHTLERKQLMNEDIGPSGGCAGNIVWAVKGSNFIIDAGLRKIEPILEHHGYIGPIDLNTIVNEEGVWALEFTPRFGYDALPAFLEMVEEPIGEIFASFANGKGADIKLKEGFGAAVRVTIPPYPEEKFRPIEGLPIRGLTRTDRPHLYFYNVKLDAKDRLVSSKSFASIGAFTSYAESIEDSIHGCLQLAEKARVPNKQYRTDLALVFREDFEHYCSMLKSKQNELTFKEEKV